MEYLLRLMRYVGEMESFCFLKGCGSFMINYMCFVDNLILFCGDIFFFMFMMLRGFVNFLNVLRLNVNESKLEIYGSNIEENSFVRVY